MRACRCAMRQLTSLPRDVMAPGSSVSSSFPCRHGESSSGRRSSLSSASAPRVHACLPACLCPQQAPPACARNKRHLHRPMPPGWHRPIIPPSLHLPFPPLPHFSFPHPSLPPSPSLPLTTTSLRASIQHPCVRERARPRRVTLPVIWAYSQGGSASGCAARGRGNPSAPRI